MNDDRIALLDLVEKAADAELVREMLAFPAERIMDAEVETVKLSYISNSRFERRTARAWRYR